MIAALQDYCTARISEFETIPPERKLLLDKIAAYIRERQHSHQPIHLAYICTHNSRRSHFGQVWARVAGAYYSIDRVQTYSGGTEATALHPNAIAALQRAGFDIRKMNQDTNPVYEVYFDVNADPCICFSKTYDHPDNPTHHFAAIMTCGDAEENCPFIPGVDLRIATTYDDPKKADGTLQQDATYDARCAQIAREVLYTFSKV